MEFNEDGEGGRDLAATDAELATAAKFDVSEEAAAREVFLLRAKPARKVAGLPSFLSRPHCGRRLNVRATLY